MDPRECTICKKTNYAPKGQLVVLATFAQKYSAENALLEIEKMHIVPMWSCIFSQKEILDKAFDNSHTLVIELHGIKDVVQLQSLYIESICKNNISLTYDVLSSKVSRDSFFKKLQN